MRPIYLVLTVLLLALTSCSKDLSYDNFSFRWKDGECRERFNAHISEREYHESVCGHTWTFCSCRHILADGKAVQWPRSELFGYIDDNLYYNKHRFVSFFITDGVMDYDVLDWANGGERLHLSAEVVFRDSKILRKEDMHPLLQILDVRDGKMVCLEQHDEQCQEGVACVSGYLCDQ